MAQTITDAQATEIGKEVIEFYRSVMKGELNQLCFRIQAAIQLENLVFDDFVDENEECAE